MTKVELVDWSFRPAQWLPGSHLQTLYPALWAAKPRISYQRERWELADGDFIDVDKTTAPTYPNAPLVLLFHGLEGSSHSHYARALMAAVSARGWRGWVLHFRGCSGELNRLPRAYHSGDSAEVADLLQRAHRCIEASDLNCPIVAVGVSLGGNALLKTLGEQAGAFNWLKAAVAVSAPLDLQASAEALRRGLNRIYTRNFLQTLKAKTLAKLAHYPGLFDASAVLACRNFHDFDELVTAPLHGFKSAVDYWQRSSSKPWLRALQTPTLVINAQNDSFLPARYLPQPDAVSSAVQLEQPRQGGHVGFLSGAYPGHLNWLPERLIAFFTAHGVG